jgi:hypothetical protein
MWRGDEKPTSDANAKSYGNRYTASILNFPHEPNDQSSNPDDPKVVLVGRLALPQR